MALKKKIVALLLAVLVCQGAGLAGAVFTAPSIPAWYQFLEKPALTPPDWVFGPVWTLLYLLMGIALYLVWEKKKNQVRKKALIFFFIQLALNVLWSLLFFGARQPIFGLLEIFGLWGSIVLTIFFFSRVSRLAARLLLPYLAWTSFAAWLNWQIVVLN